MRPSRYCTARRRADHLGTVSAVAISFGPVRRSRQPHADAVAGCACREPARRGCAASHGAGPANASRAPAPARVARHRAPGYGRPAWTARSLTLGRFLLRRFQI